VSEHRTLTIAAQAFAPDGSGYYRMFLPFRHMGQASHHMCGMAPPGNQWQPSPDDVEDLDVLVVQRPAGRAGVRLLERLTGHVKLVYETDDDMLRPDRSGLPWLVDDRMQETIRRCYRLADMVTVSTEYLAEQIRPYNEHVVVLPNHINGELLAQAQEWRAQRPAERPLLVGWQGGTTHLIDMVTVADPLRRVLEAHPAVGMHFAGYDFSPLLRSAQVRVRCSWTNWERDVWAHYKTTSAFDIAIAPLADIDFNRSKSHLKALEAAAMGQPVVAANLEPYRDFVIDGVTGFLVDNEDQFERRLAALVNDAAMREEMGSKAREVAAGWTIQDGWRLWQDAYEAVADA
jgi:glycosyltransferase involved in cell wall biosynthesis